MPVKTYNENGKCFARFGDSGTEYKYECGNEEAKNRAIKKAMDQERAIRATGWSEDDQED